MKKYIAALLVFLFLFACLSSTSVTADDTKPSGKLSLEDAIRLANQELEADYYVKEYPVKINGSYQTMELNREIWDTRQIMVYGSPTDVCT
ncbi:MAG: hypothetical protein WAP58_03685, partial [Peptococcia bacterium]